MATTTIIIRKVVEDSELTTKTPRDLAWEEIDKMGAELRKAKPDLTIAQARCEAMRTEKGRDLLAVYNDPDARLNIERYTAKKKERERLAKLGHTSWGGVLSDIAKRIAATEGVEMTVAYKLARKKAPDVAWLHDREHNRPHI